MAGEDIPDIKPPDRPNFTQRESLCRIYARQMQDLLTEEEFAALPGAQRWIRREREERPLTSPLEGDKPRYRGSKGVGEGPDRNKALGNQDPRQ